MPAKEEREPWTLPMSIFKSRAKEADARAFYDGGAVRWASRLGSRVRVTEHQRDAQGGRCNCWTGGAGAMQEARLTTLRMAPPHCLLRNSEKHYACSVGEVPCDR